MQDNGLPDLLLDEPSLMGVESIEVDTVNLRMVAAKSRHPVPCLLETDELADRVPVGEFIHAAVDLVEGDGRRDKPFDRQPARAP
jgi:hypothetical protein